MKNKTIFFISFLLPLILMFTSFVLFPKKYANSNSLTGEQLAKIYCATCHLFPEPALLDKPTWKERVLPNMGWRLGIRKLGDDPYAEIEKDEAQLVKALNIYPNKPVVTADNWKKIVAYYLQKAPERPLPQKTPPVFDSTLKGFHAEALSFGKKQIPQTSLLKFDTASMLLYIGDAQNNLYAMRANFKLLANWKLESSPVDINFQPSGYPRVLCIGSISPSQKKTGSFYSLDSTDVSGRQLSRFDKLARPVACEEADLNADGKKDLIICQFGNHTGKLSWFDGGDPRKEHILKLQPGARKIEVKDFNKDGKPDIVALMAQGREELLLFFNRGNNEFIAKTIYQFPPVYGVSYFELADFNNDGHPDILLTNGDNWDISPIRKFYHGIRILLNDGKNNFKIAQFFPFYGASKAVARDFDLDGDLDITAIAFYDDPDEPGHTFLYMENKGALKFSTASTAAAENGKWLTMEAGDLDRDGDQDIIIGSFIYSLSELTKLMSKSIETFPQVVVLWNDNKK